MEDQKVINKYQKIVQDAMVDLCLDFEIVGFTALKIGGVKVVGNEHDAVGWTDCKSIYVNAPYSDSYNLTKEHIKFLIAHEVFHILTLTRDRRNNRDSKLWNIATDFAINSILINSSGLSNNKSIGKFIEFGCYEDKYRNMSAEEIYKILVKEQNQNGNGDSNNNNNNSDSNSNGNGSSGESKQFQLDEHLDIEDPKNAEALNEAVLKAEEILKEFASQGKLDSATQRLINSLPKVKQDWRTILNNYIKSFKKAQSTWKRPNKRFFCGGDPKFGGVYLPTRYDTPNLKVAIGIDTSGSIDKKMLEVFFGHLYKIMNSFKTFEATVFCWSTIVHKDTIVKLNEKTFNQFNPLKEGYIKSNGGTIAKSGCDYIASMSMKDKPDIYIMFTDGEFYEDDIKFDACPVIMAISQDINPNIKEPKGIKRCRILFTKD